MAKKAKTKDVAKKTIEQTLWDSANELRGNLDAAEYKVLYSDLFF
jgi:type I restriction enzyme M protein